MQSAAGKRALSTLAAKIHPQLPLSPRESQQLLKLLTTSFRAHLDRAHPHPETSLDTPTGNRASNNGRRNSSPVRMTSSYASATRHMDSILSNPLFAVKPRRRGSELAAVDVFRDPMGWFVNEIAKGAADLSKASICLEALESSGHETSRLQNKKSPATIMAEWLRSSGLETSSQFLDLCLGRQNYASKFLDQLVSLLMAGGESSAAWRWFIRSNDQRIKETGYDLSRIITFRQSLLHKMTAHQAVGNLPGALATFMQAFRMMEIEGHSSAFSLLRPAGAHLVNRITSDSNQAIPPEIYQAFLQTCPRWLDDWSPAVEAMLWLHHPTEHNPLVGFRFIEDSAGAIKFVHSSRSRKNFLVRLCLGVAHELVEKEFQDAQIVMMFVKEHFPDIVLPKPSTPGVTSSKQRREQENLQLLDRLIPT